MKPAGRAAPWPGLPRQADFRQITRAGRREHNQFLIAYWRPGETDRPRAGIRVGKKVGSAVVRNRIRRILRETLRTEAHAGQPLDLVLSVRRPGNRIELRGALLGILTVIFNRISGDQT